LVNAIVTLPAFAVSVLWLNLSWPEGSAAMASRPPAALAPPDADVVCELEVAGVLDELELVLLDAGLAEELLLLEPPQAPRPSANAAVASVMVGILRTVLLAVRLIGRPYPDEPLAN
jgi:hypothetical protein